MIQRLLFALLFFCAAHAAAQPEAAYQFRHIGQQQGLLHNAVHSIGQDAEGYMWIGTSHSLQRYDGIRFKDYTPYLRSVPFLSNIDNIYFDQEKNVWINCPELIRLNAKTANVLLIPADSMRSYKPFRFSVYKDEQNHSWLLSDWGLFRAGSLNGYAPNFITVPHAGAKWMNNLCEDTVERGTWFCIGQTLYFADKQNNRIYSEEHPGGRHPLLQKRHSREISAILASSTKEIWTGCYRGYIIRYDRATMQSKEYYLPQVLQRNHFASRDNCVGTIFCMYLDTKGTLWAGTDDGLLLRYNRAADDFSVINNPLQTVSSAGINYAIHCIAEDREGQLWIGTDKGIAIFHPYRQTFRSLAHEENNPQSLPRYEVTDIFQSKKGDVYVTTWGGGFSVFDSSLQFCKTILPKGNFEYSLTWSLAEVDDTIWIGAQHGYIHILAPGAAAVKTIHPPETEISTIRYMLTDAAGNIWLALHNGKIVKWEKATHRFLRMPETIGVANKESMSHLFLDSKGAIWASTEKTLLRYDTAKRVYTGSYTPAFNGKPQVNPGISGVEQLNDTILLVATLRQGLCLFNTNTKTFAPSPVASLSATRLHAIRKDAKGNVWLTADYELLYWMLNQNTVERFKPGEHLLHAAFESPKFLLLKDGHLATTSLSEVVMFNPALLAEEKTRKIKPLIAGLRVFDNEISLDSLQALKTTPAFSYRQNFLRFQLTALSFAETGAPQFSYRLSGVEDEWHKTDEKGEAVYTNLPPGQYMLEVKNAEAERAPITAFSFRIRPPFYLTWWFLALVAAAVGSCIFALFRQRVRVVRHEAELKHRIAEAEMDALRAQMNPHFIFNCLNAIDNMIQTNQREKATTYLSRFARLIRSVLESSKSALVPLHKDVETIKLYLELERFRCSNKFDYNLNVEPELLNGDYKIPPLVVQPFLENAIHHGLLNKEEGDRQLSVVVALQDAYVKYSIHDNGVGREMARRLNEINRPDHRSYGMQISKDRIAMHNGSVNGEAVMITDLKEESKAVGTLVEVYIKTD